MDFRGLERRLHIPLEVAWPSNSCGARKTEKANKLSKGVHLMSDRSIGEQSLT